MKSLIDKIMELSPERQAKIEARVDEIMNDSVDVSGIPKLKIIRLNMLEELNTTHPIKQLDHAAYYAVLGEVVNGHYLLYCYYSPNRKYEGKILPGIYEMYRFEEVPEDEL